MFPRIPKQGRKLYAEAAGMLMRINPRRFMNSKATHTPSTEVREKVVRLISSYLSEVEGVERDPSWYMGRRLRDFPVESLELFELVMKIEDEIGKDVDDSVIDGELTISEIISKILD